ncbi:MAG: dockerin type I domain-containing protein [Defluviitaleaceae bacterium]|nr:dockerin type I domain-containing protein [Defluviitaleaceae bacterium]MCL2263105.1 dockerin type I domain-containing protein [Defluviitaleaceae bacterium]
MKMFRAFVFVFLQAFVMVTIGAMVVNAQPFAEINPNNTPLRPFPQAGMDNGLVVELMNMPAGQVSANMDILRQFANMVDTPNSTGSPLPANRSSLFRAAGQGGTGSIFLVDPATWDDPAGFRMVTTLDAGTGGTAQTPTSYRVTVCESMGYGMLMIVMLAGSEDIVLGGAFGDRTMRHVLWSGLPAPLRAHFTYQAGLPNSVSFQTYFDAMFRSLRFWPSHFVHATSGHQGWNANVNNNTYRGGTPPSGFGHSYQMAWSIHHVFGGAQRPGSPGFFQRETGPSTATDGSMDMAYALILASEQWGHEPAWCPVHRYNRTVGHTYLEWARRMVQELFDTTVHHSRHAGASTEATVNAGYFLKIGNWAGSNTAGGRLSRPSDHIMQHLKAFAEVNPQRDWQRVINVTYDSHRFVRQWHQPGGQGATAGPLPNTGILPDFIRFDHVNSNPQPDGTGNIWIIPPQHTGGGSFHETSSDGATHWNACRVPWRLGVDLLFSGRTPHQYSDITIAALNNWHAQQNNNNFNSVHGRWLDGRPNTDQWGNIGQTSNAFGGPMLVPAAVFGPQAWLNSGWQRANPALPAPSSFNFYGDYINILTMVAASGNEWTPVGSPLTVTDGTTANGHTHMRRVVAGARVPLRANQQNPALFGGWVVTEDVQFWPGYTAAMPNTYIIMPRNTHVFAIADGTPPVTHMLTIITDGTNPQGAGNRIEGNTVSVNAGENAGSAFLRWTIADCAYTADISALHGIDPTAWATTFTMPTHPVTLTAEWTTYPDINHATLFLYMFTLSAAGADDWSTGGFNNASAGSQMHFDITAHQDITHSVTWPNATDGRAGVLHGTHRDIYVALPLAARSPDMLPVSLYGIRVNGVDVFGAVSHAPVGSRWLVPGTIGSAATHDFVSFGGAMANAAATNTAFADAGMELRTFFLPANAFLIPPGATVDFILRVGDGNPPEPPPFDCDYCEDSGECCEYCNPCDCPTFDCDYCEDSGECCDECNPCDCPTFDCDYCEDSGDCCEYCNPCDCSPILVCNICEGAGRVHPFAIGDANDDGRVTSADATRIARWLTTAPAYRESISICLRAADVNGDNEITTADLILLARWLVGHAVSIAAAPSLP